MWFAVSLLEIVSGLMTVRKIRDEHDAHACLEAASSSGLSRRDWARAHGVDGRSLHAWYLKLSLSRGEIEMGTSARLVELVPNAVPRASNRGFVVRKGDFEIEFGSDFDEEALGRVLRVAGAC